MRYGLLATNETLLQGDSRTLAHLSGLIGRMDPFRAYCNVIAIQTLTIQVRQEWTWRKATRAAYKLISQQNPSLGAFQTGQHTPLGLPQHNT